MKIIAILRKHAGIALLVFFTIAGLLIFDDYGISWDEPGSHEIGTLNYKYIFSGDKELLTYPEKDYGIAFELPLVIIERLAGLEDSRQIYLARHLLTHLFFLMSAFFFFKLIDLLYKNKVLASIGFLLIVLNPLLYAHSFMNSKDIPFMDMLIICFYLSAIAFKSKKTKHFILLGMLTGLLVNMRIIGILPFACIIFLQMMDIVGNESAGRKKNTLLLAAFLLTSVSTLYISWPYLWPDPVKNFLLAIQRMSKYTWYGDLLFNGTYVRSTRIAWYYIPVWFGITTPIPYLIAGFMGLILIVFHFFRRPLDFIRNTLKRNNLFYVVCFFAPVFAVIYLKSVLYDSWRHLFFIYPSFVLMGIYGLHIIFTTRARNITLIAMFIIFCFSGYFMIRNHPFQQVYFNNIVDTKTPEHLRKQFELDYWGSSYMQSLEYILKNDNSPIIYVAAQHEPGRYNLLLLKPEDRARIRLVDLPEATYYITSYRWHPHDYDEYKNMEWHTFKVSNNSINTVFKIR